MIDMNKKYISNSIAVRILCTDRNSSDGRSVVAMDETGRVSYYTESGKYGLSKESEFDLTEIGEPTSGEWCYFWNNKDMLPVVLQFSKLPPKAWGSNYGAFNSIQPNIRFDKEANEYYTSTNWNFCAPFNGKFPEEFKGA